MMIEVEAQLQRLRATGLPLRYLDEHMGVGWLPGLRARLRELAAREKLLDVAQVPHLSEADAARIVESVENRAGAAVWVLHPAFDDAEMWEFHETGQARGAVARARNGDRLAALNEDLLRAARAGRVRLARYSEIEIPGG